MATDIEVIVSPAVVSTDVTVAPASIVTSVEIATGVPGATGPAGSSFDQSLNTQDAPTFAAIHGTHGQGGQGLDNGDGTYSPSQGGTGGYINVSGGAGTGGDVGAGGNGGVINLSGGDCSSLNNAGSSGSIDMHGAGGYSIDNGGSLITCEGGGSIDTRGTGTVELGYEGYGSQGSSYTSTRTVLRGTATEHRDIYFPNNSGTLVLDAPSDGNQYARSNGSWNVVTVFSGAYSDLTGAPSLGSASTHAASDFQASGNYATLIGGTVPSSQLPSVVTWSTLTGKPAFGTASSKDVAASGNASSTQVVLGSDTRLTDARTPTAHTQAASTITGLATVATTGSYSDLSGKPSIPTTTDGLTEGTINLYFTSARAISAVTWSTLTGKPTFATVATSGSYADLSNKPTLFSGSYTDLTNKPTIPGTTDGLTEGTTNLYFTSARAISAVTWSTLTGKPTFATVATSGSASDLSTGTLADSRLSSNVALLSAANTFTASQTIASGTLTASAPALNVTQTWNASAVSFTAIKANITDTASTSTSILMDLQVGGTSKFKIYKNSSVVCDFVGSETATRTAISSSGGVGARFGYNQTAVIASNDLQFGSANDVVLSRDAANTLALRNSTNAQKFSVYNTYTDASNFEYVSIDWSATANTAIISTRALGTGVARPLTIGAGSTALTTIGNNATGSGVTIRHNNGALTNFNSDGSVSISPQTGKGVYITTGGGFYIQSGTLHISNAATPASSSDTGSAGTIQWDASYIYVCTATNTWKRAAISTW